ncbi:hypothetical protein [Bradyrhizobium sp.]|uniref:hypothetical protein n=1 Tax=Bradyrhizobium sp. TaxID=376 RepID=UPI0025C2D421|nr:hypothetical protein [Bradyrhizobium sp.]
MSTEVPVDGMEYLVQRTGCAEAIAVAATSVRSGTVTSIFMGVNLVIPERLKAAPETQRLDTEFLT